MPSNDRREFYAAAGAGILTLALLLPTLTLNRLLGLDEAVYAQIAREALENGHWLPLYWRGEPFFDKPVTIMWLQALGLKLFGYSEFAVRLPAALAASAVVYLVVRLGSRLSGSLLLGCLAAVWLVAQKHFLLFGRVGTLDMALAACLLAAWRQAGLAGDTPDTGQAQSRLLYAGLWLSLAVWIKSWLGLALLPALVVAFFSERPVNLTRRDLILRLCLPPLLAMLAFLIIYTLAYGPVFLKWEATFNLAGRTRGSGFFSVLRDPAASLTNLEAYGRMALEGAATLWPLGLGGLLAWVSAGLAQTDQPDPFGRTGVLFTLSWLAAMMLVFQQNINYFVVLLPFLALSWAWLAGTPKQVVGWILFGALTLLGLIFALGLVTPGPVFGLALALAFAAVFLDQREDVKIAMPSGVRVFVVAVALAALGLQTPYWLHPPDPNAQLVKTALENPAQVSGEELLLVAHPVEGHLLEFYTDYRTVAIPQAPDTAPEKPLLGRFPGGIKFFRPLKGRP